MKSSEMCQSCGMPLAKDPQHGGTNADGSKNEKYCSYCYQQGKFSFEGTVKEFQAHCRQKMVEGGHSRFVAWLFTLAIPRLERWKK